MIITESQTITQSLKPDVVLGKHAIIELSECDTAVIENHKLLQSLLKKATEIANVAVVGSIDYCFKPQGYTAALILEESHLSIHTWPEYQYVSIDLYSCNLETDFQAVKNFFVAQFKATLTGFTIIDRGFSNLDAEKGGL